MMKGKKTPENGKRTSKKVLGLFDGSLIIKTLNHASKKKQTQRKTREFIQKHANTTSPHSKYSPGKIDALKDFDHLQFIPTVELTREQVENLVKTSSELHQTFGKFGAVKIRLPKDCEPLPLDLHKTKRKLTIRQQELPMLPKGKVRVEINRLL